MGSVKVTVCDRLHEESDHHVILISEECEAIDVA